MPRLLLALTLLLPATLLAAPIRVLLPIGSSGSTPAEQVAALLQGRDVAVTKTSRYPTEAELAQAEVLILSEPDEKVVPTDYRASLEKFAQRGGGFLVLQGGVMASDAAWWKSLIGGAWVPGTSQNFLSKMMLYVATDQHRIVRGASPFDLEDETLYDLDLDPKIQVLGSAFTPKTTGVRENRRERASKTAQPARANIYDLQPQLWAYENTLPGGQPHRALVALQGAPATLQHASFRTFLLRGLAWAAHRDNLDALCTPAELGGLRYPAGGPETPERTVAQFEHHPDFHITLAASEPLINKPIAIQWDERGRLWVAETPEYPNGRRPLVAEPWKETAALDPAGNAERPARDRISILSDPDASGRFTRKTVFFEGLELVTGFCLYKDGVIALAQPDIVFIHGTGPEQKIERLFTGFTPGDTHFVGNHLIVAPDGWIYADMGGGATVKAPASGQELARISSGLFRFQPDGSRMEQVSSKGGNGFGAEVTSDGELFFGQATSGDPIQHVALPESILARGKVGTAGGAQSVIRQRKVVIPKLPERIPLMQIDQVGGYSAACSSTVYEGGAWPAEWERSLFCTEPILNIIHHEALRPSGATFTGEMVRRDAEFIHSPDYWFRPVDVSIGPDGALYILDFYNPVIAHSDTRGPLHSRSGASVRPDREHYFGRIYRVQHQAAKPLVIPDLSKASPTELAAALKHENKIVRFNALRLLVERPAAEVTAALAPLTTSDTPVPARILALWGLQRLHALAPETLKAALHDPEPTIRKTGALMVEASSGEAVQTELAAGLADPDLRTQIAMLRALASTKLSPASAAALVAIYARLSDDLTRSAAIAAAASSSVEVITAALASDQPAAAEGLVRNVAARMVETNDADGFATLLGTIASHAAQADLRAQIVLEAAAQVKAQPATTDFTACFKPLLASPNAALSAAALPLAARWSHDAQTQSQVRKLVADLLPELSDPKTPEARRGELIVTLIGARATSPEVLPTIGKLLLDPAVPEDLKRQAVRALGSTDDPATGTLLASVFEALSAPVQQTAVNLILTRASWIAALLDRVESGAIKASILGPANIFRLRSHPDKAVAARAAKVLGQTNKTNTDKDKLIAQLTPIVTQPGNAAHGRELFTQACAICHKFGDLGKEVGPVLTGIGAHGPEPLLVSIVDPSRQIDAGYELFNIETKDGQLLAGIIAQENDARLVLRSNAGDVEVPKASIKTTTNTHRSLMPEGFEGLGGEALRDILAFLCGTEARFRVLDLSAAFTADSRRGLYQSLEALHDTLTFTRFGIANVDGIPFDLANPQNSALGGNLIVLRGGPRDSFAHSLPRQVEVKVELPARAFHFLGGVAGWGARRAEPDGAPILKVTMVFADGRRENATLHNGVEFADYIAPIDVPGSRLAEGVVKDKQIRWFTVPVPNPGGIVKKLILESFDNGPAPTLAAITADLNPP